MRANVALLNDEVKKLRSNFRNLEQEVVDTMEGEVMKPMKKGITGLVMSKLQEELSIKKEEA